MTTTTSSSTRRFAPTTTARRVHTWRSFVPGPLFHSLRRLPSTPPRFRFLLAHPSLTGATYHNARSRSQFNRHTHTHVSWMHAYARPTSSVHFQHHLCGQVKWRDAGVSLGCSDTTVDYAVPDVEVVCTRVRGVRSSVVHFSQLSFCLGGSRIYLVPLVVTFSPVCSARFPYPLFILAPFSLRLADILASSRVCCGSAVPSSQGVMRASENRGPGR